MTPTTKEQVYENVERAGITLAMLRSKSRLQAFAYARVAVAHKLKQFGMSSTAIGKELNRDHSSVVVMWSKANEWFKNPKHHKHELAFIDNVLNGREVTVVTHDTPDKIKYPFKVRRDAYCVECDKYPCFKGMENLSSNLAGTCPSFKLS